MYPTHEKGREPARKGKLHRKERERARPGGGAGPHKDHFARRMSFPSVLIFFAFETITYIRELKAKGVEVYFEKENIWTFDSKGEMALQRQVQDQGQQG